MFGHFVFREITKKTETPQKIFFQMDSDSMPETRNAFLGTLSCCQSPAHTYKEICFHSGYIHYSKYLDFFSFN